RRSSDLKWRMANQMRAELEAIATGYQGGMQLTEAQMHQLINKDLAQIEAEKAAFEEVRALLAAKGQGYLRCRRAPRRTRQVRQLEQVREAHGRPEIAGPRSFHVSGGGRGHADRAAAA